MPEITPKLGLKKPLGTETVNRASQRENLDIMDQNAASQAELDAVSATATNAQATANAAETPAGAQVKVDTLAGVGNTKTVKQLDDVVTTHEALQTAHGAVSAPTASKMMVRDASGRAQVAAPSAAADIARKDTVDAVQTNLTTHLAEYTNMISARNGLNANALINFNFDIPQRGMSFTNLLIGYLLDRWFVSSASDGGTMPTSLVLSQNALTTGDIFGSKYFLRLNTNGAGSSFGTSAIYAVNQRIENGTSKLCGVGKQVTVSFWAKSDIVGKRMGVNLLQSYGSGGSPSSFEYLTGQIITLTSTWTRYTVTFTTNTIVGKTFGTNNDDYLQLRFSYMWGTVAATSNFGGGTAETFVGAGDIDIAQAQLCAGDTALPFQPRSFAEELALCQRYYEKSYAYATAPATAAVAINIETKVVPSNSIAVDQVYGKTSFKVKKRTTPTMVIYPYATPSNTGRVSSISGGDLGASSGTSSQIGDDGFAVVNSSGGALITTGNAVIYHWTADAEI